MSAPTLNQLSKKYNRIPLVRYTLADLDTPVSAYLKLANQPNTYLFESVHGGDKWGRYSIIGLQAKTIVKIFGNNIQVSDNGTVIKNINDPNPFDWLENYQKQFRVAPLQQTTSINPKLDNFDLFTGGLVGFFAYDCIKLIEPKLANIQNQVAKNPDILLMVSDEIVVFDTLRDKIYIVIMFNPELDGSLSVAQKRLDEVLAKLHQPLPKQLSFTKTKLSEQDIKYSFKEQDFKKAVNRIKEYIVAGDVMQVVLAQKMQIPYKHKPFNVYRTLRSLNPSPYLFYVNLEGLQIVGSSPEILVHLKNNKLTVRPLAGTRRRGKDEAEDSKLAQELLNDPKELAEHLMLIDLGRNDIGRVCQPGSVKMTETMQIEKYSHVMHIVSNVEGELKPNTSLFKALTSTFPAGTLSGAPKIRAMEIIDELEPNQRGIYGGAVGYCGWHDNLDTAIAIRTAVIQDNQLYVQAGAGIVFDSDPDLEWQETMNKARGIIKAATIAADNFGDE